MDNHAKEVEQGERFAFGANWSRFLTELSDERIEQAKLSLIKMLGVDSLIGLTFLDIGSGSGLFSLAARSLGATVHSFDYDHKSVACTKHLKQRYFEKDRNWVVEQGSVLDKKFLSHLGRYDIVYSWGVLHHTGHMWEALGYVASLVKPGGRLFIAIYNDQGRASKIWLVVKQLYNVLPSWLRVLVVIPSFIRLWLPTIIRDLLAGKPFRTWKTYQKDRGMSPWRDVVDWVGGYPFEVAKPEEIFDFYRAKGFCLEKLTTCAGGLGCNEFVFSSHSQKEG